MSNSFLFSFYCATCITTSKPLISPPAIKRMQEHIIYGKKQSQNKKSKTVWANKGKMMQILQKTSRLNTEALEVKTEWKHEPNPSIWRKVVATKGEHFKNTKQWFFFFYDWCELSELLIVSKNASTALCYLPIILLWSFILFLLLIHCLLIYLYLFLYCCLLFLTDCEAHWSTLLFLNVLYKWSLNWIVDR